MQSKTLWRGKYDCGHTTLKTLCGGLCFRTPQWSSKAQISNYSTQDLQKPSKKLNLKVTIMLLTIKCYVHNHFYRPHIDRISPNKNTRTFNWFEGVRVYTVQYSYCMYCSTVSYTVLNLYVRVQYEYCTRIILYFSLWECTVHSYNTLIFTGMFAQQFNYLTNQIRSCFGQF